MSFISKLRENKLLNQTVQSNDSEQPSKLPLINVADKETYMARMNICNSCEHLFKLTKTCKKCGCFMTVKTRLAEVTCPIGKW